MQQCSVAHGQMLVARLYGRGTFVTACRMSFRACDELPRFGRFNWYRDSSDWKPFHNDSAAYNPQRAKQQNITVGVSFGAERELSFLHGTNASRVYFPQCNGAPHARTPASNTTPRPSISIAFDPWHVSSCVDARM